MPGRPDHPWRMNRAAAVKRGMGIGALIGTLGVGIPVVLYFALGARSEKMLAWLKDWMTQHNAVIMSVLCLIIAAKLIGDAIGSLAG